MGQLPNGVASAHTDPVGNRAVLALLLGQDLLDLESFVRRLHKKTRHETFPVAQLANIKLIATKELPFSPNVLQHNPAWKGYPRYLFPQN